MCKIFYLLINFLRRHPGQVDLKLTAVEDFIIIDVRKGGMGMGTYRLCLTKEELDNDRFRPFINELNSVEEKLFS